MLLFTHHSGEPHGILGAQAAATFLERRLSIPSIVVGIERDYAPENLFRFIKDHYRDKEKVAAFSHLCGRKDLFELARELKRDGFTTVLGGPQAREDYRGEPDAGSRPNRFQGLRSSFDIAFQGPVNHLKPDHLKIPGMLVESPWTRDLFLEVDWSNLYLFSDNLKKLDVRLAQVLNAIGCPHAKKSHTATLPPPDHLRDRGIPEMEVRSKGCIFCDVAWDKGYHGLLDRSRVLSQIEGLPESEGRKIPFELIDEFPIRSLGPLIEDVARHGVRLSQINLVCRVDDINAHSSELSDLLSLAMHHDVKILFASIGFESFADRMLSYLCKGITVDDIVRCVETLRRLKLRFVEHLLYRRDEDANHGFIRPTPWDDGEMLREIDTTIFLNRFFEDILPAHSTPLIIHHASSLGDWIRKIEETSEITFSRNGTWIEWWNPSPV